MSRFPDEVSALNEGGCHGFLVDGEPILREGMRPVYSGMPSGHGEHAPWYSHIGKVWRSRYTNLNKDHHYDCLIRIINSRTLTCLPRLGLEPYTFTLSPN